MSGWKCISSSPDWPKRSLQVQYCLCYTVHCMSVILVNVNWVMLHAVFVSFVFQWKVLTKKHEAPNIPKREFLCFCMWIVYFLTNINDFFCLYNIHPKQYGNKFCELLPFPKYIVKMWSTPQKFNFAGL